MLDPLLDRFASSVTRRRKLVLALVFGATALFASQLPKLRLDASPEQLMISYGGYEERARAFRERFGDVDSVVTLLVTADDVTSLPALRYVHRLSRHFSADPRVVRVESVTVTPLGFGAQPESGAGEGTLEDLDALEASEAGADALLPAIEAALTTLIESEPERFPMGLLSIAERVGPARAPRPLVEGEIVTAEEAEAIAAALEDAPLVVGRLVSRDRRLAAVVVFLDPALGTGLERIELVHEMNAWLAANPPPQGVSVHATGIPHLRATIHDAMLADQLVLVPISVLLCTILLYVSFRSTAGVVLPLAMVGMTVVSTLGAMAFAGEPLSILMNTLPTLLIIMGISEAVHVVGRYFEEQRTAPDRIEASRRAIRRLMIACFLTSFTTAVGFGSLVVAQTDMLRRFGVVAASGVMIGYAILITFVPAAIPYFPAPRSAAPKRNARAAGARPGRLEAFLVRATATIARRPLPVVIGTALVALPSAWAYATVEVDTALLDTFDPDDPVVVSTRLVERHLDGILPLQIHVRSDGRTDVRDPAVLAALDRVARWGAEQEGVLRAHAPGDVLWETWRRLAGIGADEERAPFRSRAQVDALLALLAPIEPSPMREWMSADGRHARVELRLADVGAKRSVALIEAVEERARRELAPFEGLEVVLLGEAMIGTHGVTAVVEDLFGSLSLSALVIFVTIGLLFRSPRLGVLAIPPNVIPQIGTVAWMVLRGIPLNAGTAIVFSVAIGVSVDLTIHGFARLVEEERAGLARRAAVVRVARSTGRAIVTSCTTLVLGFSVLMASGFVPVRHFGELIAVALTISLLTTLVFQPAMMMLAGGPRRRATAERAVAAAE
ncbi:MAG TPA: MMPL family transporter [Sandaracinaceae bacterium]